MTDRPLDLTGLRTTDVHEHVARHRIAERSDAEVLSAVSAVLAAPKRAAADSFVLHAPLELLARGALLPWVRPEGRPRATARLVGLAAGYAEAGEERDTPPTPEPEPAPSIAARLAAAVAAGDLDDADGATYALATVATPAEIRHLLAPTVATSLAAAAHGSILLALLPRVGPSGATSHLARGLVQELARHPEWQLRWFEDPDEAPVGPALEQALLDVPMLGPAGDNFIQPIMQQAEDSGLAPKLLSAVVDGGPIDAGRVRRQLSRVAAWSMLQEPGGHAYGWTHCLTMPQAVMSLAGDALDTRTATAVAATHVVGFRAAIGKREVVPDFAPTRPDAADLAEALAGGPGIAASYAWFVAGGRPDQVDALVSGLATAASAHGDAHYVKYTLACFDAAAADPQQQPLDLAAAAFLAGWWAAKGDDDFFDGAG